MKNICAFPHILGSPSSYMTLQLLRSEFPYICMRKILFYFLSVYPIFWSSLFLSNRFDGMILENWSSGTRVLSSQPGRGWGGRGILGEEISYTG